MKNKTQKKPEAGIKSSVSKGREVQLNDLKSKKAEEVKGGRRPVL